MTTTTPPLVLARRAGLDARVEMNPQHIVAGLFADNLERFLAGRPLRETVDRARGY
jgi:hypothetical protein